MDRLQNLAFYNFSWQNKYAQNFNVAYKRATEAQSKIKKAQHSANINPTEFEKYTQDLKRWEKKAEDYSILAKKEEKQLETEKQNTLGQNINFLA